MKSKFITSLLLVSILQVACNINSAPKCNDDKVKKLAIQGAVETIVKKSKSGEKTELMIYLRGNEEAIQEYQKSEKQLNGLGTSTSEYLNNLLALSDLMGGENNRDSLLQALVDSSLETGNIFLDAIVTDKIDKEIKKCDCSANLNMGKYLHYTISFSGQNTEEDGRLIVKTRLKSTE